MALFWASHGSANWGQNDGARSVRRVTGVVVVLAAVMVASSATSATELHAAIVKPTYVTSIGGGLTGHAEIYPGGVDVDANGIVYVADTGNDDVKAYYPNGARGLGYGQPRREGALATSTTRATSPTWTASCTWPTSATSACRCWTPSRASPITAWPTVFPSPIGISAGVDGSGNPIILVTQDVKNQVTAFKPDGTPTGEHFGTGTAGSGNGQLNAPRDAATDSAGNVYVADYANDRIAKFVSQRRLDQVLGQLGRAGRAVPPALRRGGGRGQQDLRGRLDQPPRADLRLQRQPHRELRHRAGAAAADRRRAVRDAAPRGGRSGRLASRHLHGRPVGLPGQPRVAECGLSAQLHLRPDVRQRAAGRRRVQRALRAHLRKRAPVRGRLRQPAHGLLQPHHLRLPGQVGRARVGRRPAGLQLAARHHLHGGDKHRLGGRHQERPPGRVQYRRHPDRPHVRHAGRRSRAAEPALRRRRDGDGADRGRLHQQPGGAHRHRPRRCRRCPPGRRRFPTATRRTSRSTAPRCWSPTPATTAWCG